MNHRYTTPERACTLHEKAIRKPCAEDPHARLERELGRRARKGAAPDFYR